MLRGNSCNFFLLLLDVVVAGVTVVGCGDDELRLPLTLVCNIMLPVFQTFMYVLSVRPSVRSSLCLLQL